MACFVNMLVQQELKNSDGSVRQKGLSVALPVDKAAEELSVSRTAVDLGYYDIKNHTLTTKVPDNVRKKYDKVKEIKTNGHVVKKNYQVQDKNTGTKKIVEKEILSNKIEELPGGVLEEEQKTETSIEETTKRRGRPAKSD